MNVFSFLSELPVNIVTIAITLVFIIKDKSVLFTYCDWNDSLSYVDKARFLSSLQSFSPSC